MDKALADRLAAATSIVAVILASIAVLTPHPELGMQLVRDGQYVRIASVEPFSPARREGFEAGMVVLALNGVDLVQLPSYDKPRTDSNGNPIAQPIGQPTLEPSQPTPVNLDAIGIDQLLATPISDLWATQPGILARWVPNESVMIFLGRDYSSDLHRTVTGLLAGMVIIAIGLWWLASGRGGASLKTLAMPLAVATGTPLVISPLAATWFGPAVAAAGVLAPLGMIPLALRLVDRIEDLRERTIVRSATLAGAAVAITIGLVRPLVDAQNDAVGWAWSLLVAAVPLLAGLAAAGPVRIWSPVRNASSGRVLQSAELAAAGATPLMAMGIDPRGAILLLPLSVWLVGLAVASRFTIRPLARLVMRAQLQRDLIVAATEAERARVAADIHDDALQELTLLVRRLDEAGDTEGAEIARTVSDRLRAICGDLRLPILDDLGVGPALDWLALRIERLAGGEVRLERVDGKRPPADVELAFFRVAQEALANAVKHGKPPIIVRYRSTDQGASLSVDDAGPGIPLDAAAQAEASGHFGLMNMAQRAEQVGAILDVRRWPAGGTHVALEWRPR